MKIVATLVITAMLSGCAITQVTHDYCALAAPITVHCLTGPLGCAEYAPGYDYLTDGTAQEIETHDLTYVKTCHK